MNRKKILLVSQNLDDMILEDSKILKKYYDVDVLIFRKYADIFKLPKLIAKILKSDICFVWFATAYAALTTFLCRLFGKKSIVVTGGYDIVDMPEINYGLLAHPIKKYFPAIAFRFTDKILPFSKDSASEILKRFQIKKEKIDVVYLGVRQHFGKPAKKKNIVVTLGVVKEENILRKGLEIFVKAAKYVPEARFILIGNILEKKAYNYLKTLSGKNVEFLDLGYNTEEIMNAFDSAKVYVQVSAHEGFGRALVEAMSRKCVPVVTRRGALPEVVGNTGFYIPFGNPEETAKVVKKALKSKKGNSARKRAALFTLEKREKALIRNINEL